MVTYRYPAFVASYESRTTNNYPMYNNNTYGTSFHGTKATLTLTGPTTIGGIAHAGSRGVKRVEVSVDGGRSWVDAQLRPPLSQNSWTIWRM